MGYRHGSLQGRSTIPPKFSPELQRRILEAREHLAVAERELEAALSELKAAERADKKMISERLETAFSKLAAGRRNLEAILQEDG
jgi:guanylate kinase